MENLPEKPSEKDCCGSGCSPCVYEVYENMLEKYRNGTLNSPTPCSKNIRQDLLSPLKYKPFLLMCIENINKNTNLYCFRPLIYNSENVCTSENSTFEPCHEILPYSPGQHIIMCNVKRTNENPIFELNAQSISRAYTPISLASMQKKCCLKLLIKLYENGALSSFINQLTVDDVVFFRGPFGDFYHVPNSRYLMICGGTGFAPMFPIIENILHNEEDESVVRLCFACSKFSDIYFREKIRQFSRYWNFEAHIYLSKESEDQILKNVVHNENIYSQKITLDVIKKQIFPMKHRVLICGSDSFNKDIQKFAQLCGCDDVYTF